MTMAHFMKAASLYILPEPRAIYAEGLRKAGMPEG